jgi:hypothetical protein
MDAVNNARLDRSAFEIVSLDSEGDDRDYWSARSPLERMEALELMRQIIYWLRSGYHQTAKSF